MFREDPRDRLVGPRLRARAGRVFDFLGHYRAFLLDPGTLVTLLSGFLLGLALVVAPGAMFGAGEPGQPGMLLYLASALAGSAFIWWSALQGVREGDFTADIPVSIATVAAIAIGQYPAAAVVAVLLLLGGMLEDFVAARADRALEALAGLLPDRVTVRREGGDLVVPRETLKIGDLILIKPGERIAADGNIVSGAASINQAAITGESVPVEKGPGDAVFAGTLLEAGAIEVRTAKAEGETTLGQIRRLIEEAREQKPPIERLLDRYAKLYTPIALALGGLLWWWSGDVMRAITMLIVFCPCVMVLATPTALVASVGNAALRGSLVKKGATIEALAGVDTVIFDKTGTLTTGRPVLARVAAVGRTPDAELLGMAATAEKYSEHPVGRAIVAAALERDIPVADPGIFRTFPGLGVGAQADGRQVIVGRPKALAENGVPVSRELAARAELEAGAGRNVVLVAIDGAVCGLLALEDEVRPEAPAAVARLREAGLRTVIVTGDNGPATQCVASRLGIGEVHAEIMPAEKVEIVRRLQGEGRRVAFVGDGVNDGPALARADVGVAMGLSGTDVAIETAEVGLLADDLARLPHLIAVSRRAIRTIRQNVLFALGVLALAVVLTVPGILSPVTGALLHELSSIPVIVNSARLINWRSP
ncbi:MAG TPA: cation-translocating P-type ATPase [Methanocella sp.]|nr:cation-translocating P-type ATPase [Methanocella sp.]